MMEGNIYNYIIGVHISYNFPFYFWNRMLISFIKISRLSKKIEEKN